MGYISWCVLANSDEGERLKLPLQQQCPGDVVVTALHLQHQSLRVRLPAVRLSANNLGQVVHTRVPLSQSSITWYWSSCGDALRLGR